MKKRMLLASAAMALSLTLGATPAMAGSNIELLKRLHAKGILTDEEFQALADEDAKAASAPAAPQAAAPSGEGKRFVEVSDSGVGMQVGDVTFKVSGSVNGFYTHDNGQAPGPNTAVVGGVVPIGGSYGESHLHYANAADALANPTLLDTNSSWVAQARYGLTSWVTLIGEYIHTKAEAHNNNSATANTIAAGAILFF